jgi:hypothetical protein
MRNAWSIGFGNLLLHPLNIHIRYGEFTVSFVLPEIIYISFPTFIVLQFIFIFNEMHTKNR